MRANHPDTGEALTGTDRFFVTVCVVIAGDDGSSRKQYVQRQLSDIPVGKLSNVEKLDLLSHCKAIYSAAVKAATNDDV